MYLGAITVFGKGPAYIAIGPVYWGEIVLAISLLWALRRWRRVVIRTARARILTLSICCFLVLGAVELIANYPVWGLDALRDSAVCYYSLFYFVGLAIASDSEQKLHFCSRWKLFWIIAIPWAAAELITQYRFSGLAPDIGSHGSVLGSSGSEIAQSLGLGCLLLLSEDRRGRFLGTTARVAVATIGLAVVASIQERGVKLAILAAFIVLVAGNLFDRSPGRVFGRKLSAMLLILMAVLATAIASGVDIGTSLQLDRFRGASLDNPDATVAFRTDWWSKLYEQVMERNQAFGLGFGENLADYNPDISNQSEAQNPLRSPHNYNMTVFSRLGLLGLLIWCTILLSGVFDPLWRLLSASTNAERAEAREKTFWVAAIVATWVNSSFGVLMEGPVMGIPFWLMLGLITGQPYRTVNRAGSPTRPR